MTGGVVNIFLRASLSSIVDGEVLSFLQASSVTLPRTVLNSASTLAETDDGTDEGW